MFLHPPFETDLPPQRIISLVPSQTELLAYLGAAKETIAITKFCIHPEEWFRSKTRIGGTKNLNIDKIISLEPDLILSNKEENVKEQVEALAEYYPVYMSDIKTFEDALEMIREIGRLIHKAEKAYKLVDDIYDAFARIPLSTKKLKSIYLIWQEPYMSVGGDSFISDMMYKAGFANLLRNEERYPELSIDKLVDLKPECLLLSSEPFPFKEKHIPRLQAALPNTKILLVDGEMFSWYGSRMLYSPPYFEELSHRCSQIG